MARKVQIMRTVKTLSLAAALSAAVPAAALPLSPSERARAFAVCTGTYSALVEHQRLFDGMISEESETRRDLFAGLLDTVLPDAVDYGLPPEQAMAWRVEAKAVQAQLLSASVFNMMPQRARPARAAATANIATCDQLIFGT